MRNNLISGIKRYEDGPLPKYLFLTSSGFCGIDLVDADAMTIVVSNTGKTWQMIDLLTDLKQAISRQRNKNNPNYGSYIYIFNQSVFSEDEDSLLKRIEDIREKIILNIPHYDELKSKGKESAFMCDSDFKEYTLFKNGRYVLNETAFNADKYFILETRKQYSQGFDIKGRIGEGIELVPVSLPKSVTYRDLVAFFEDNHHKGEIDWDQYSTRYEWIKLVEDSYRLYKKVWKDYSHAKAMVENYNEPFNRIKLEMKRSFATGSVYSRKEAREILVKIYSSNGINRVPKFSDFREALLVREKKIHGERMIEILGKL